MPFWYDEEFMDICRFGLRVKEKLFSKRSAYQLVEVLETEGFGRALVIDGIFMASERDEHLYHEMMVHPVLAGLGEIRDVLVIGGGDGGTVREVLSYPEVESVTMVEIDGTVVEASKRYLRHIGTAWEDPRLDLRIGDGIDFAKKATPASYDAVLLDHSDPVGPAEGLFNEEFYRDCKRLLKPNGAFCLQSESPVLQTPLFLDVVRTLKRVFSSVHPYFGSIPLYGTGAWSWTVASNGADVRQPDFERSALQERRCRYYNAEIHRAAFALPNELKGRIA